MTDIVKGMARAFAFEHDDPRDFRASEAELVEWYSPAMRAALLWLAENVSDEMADARAVELNIDDIRSSHKTAIAAAIRAAAGGEG